MVVYYTVVCLIKLWDNYRSGTVIFYAKCKKIQV